MKRILIFLFAVLALFSCEGWELSSQVNNEETIALDETTACELTLAKKQIGEKGVCVKAYIIGGDLTSSASGISFEAPFEAATHLAIADTLGITEKSACVSVQLPAGQIRQALNLVDHPENLGRLVYLKGDVVASYFGLVGIKNVTDFVLK